jgi:hypothetical protein
VIHLPLDPILEDRIDPAHLFRVTRQAL